MGKRVKSTFHYKNYESHERQRAYIVFYFHAKETADFFESLLLESDLPYERGEGSGMLKRHLIGVHSKHQLAAEELNDQANNYFRKPFLGHNGFRNVLLVFTLLLILLALIGFFKANK